MIQLTASVYAMRSSLDKLSQSFRISILSSVQPPSRRSRSEVAAGAAVTLDRTVERANAINERVDRTMLGTMQ
jgi:hypothetical protein